MNDNYPEKLNDELKFEAKHLVFIDYDEELSSQEIQDYITNGDIGDDLHDSLFEQAHDHADELSEELAEKYNEDGDQDGDEAINPDDLRDYLVDTWLNEHSGEVADNLVRNTGAKLFQFSVAGAEDTSESGKFVEDWNMAQFGYTEELGEREGMDAIWSVRLGALAFITPSEARELNEKGGSVSLAEEGLFVCEYTNGSGFLCGSGANVSAVPGSVTLDEYAGDKFGGYSSANDLFGLVESAFVPSSISVTADD